jgi:hypothetical protein
MLCGEGFFLPLSIRPLEAKRSKLSRECVKKLGVRGRELSGTMNETTSFKRLILRAVLRQVSPMVIRLVSVSDQDLPQFHEIFSALLGWNGDLGYLISVHGQEFNSFRCNTRSKGLHEFKLHRQEKFLYLRHAAYVGVGCSSPGYSGRC